MFSAEKLIFFPFLPIHMMGMSKFYIAVLGLTALLIAGTGAFFSIFGLAELFTGAAKPVIFMAAVLELGKIVSTGFLYRYWGHINLGVRTYLCVAVIALISITSLGIFGFLSSAYQKSSMSLRTHNLKLKTLVEEDERLHTQMADIRKFIDAIPSNRISKKLDFETSYRPKLSRLQSASDKIQAQITSMKIELLNTQAKIGPITYTAEALHMDVDSVVKYLIFLFVMVFDPLAVCLVMCWNLAIRLQEKYRGDEGKIAAHSLMGQPVDHRYRKAG